MHMQPQEDAKLVELVEKHGAQNWTLIAQVTLLLPMLPLDVLSWC
jgi:Myb-like DNA-binding domain